MGSYGSGLYDRNGRFQKTVFMRSIHKICYLGIPGFHESGSYLEQESGHYFRKSTHRHLPPPPCKVLVLKFPTGVLTWALLNQSFAYQAMLSSQDTADTQKPVW